MCSTCLLNLGVLEATNRERVVLVVVVHVGIRFVHVQVVRVVAIVLGRGPQVGVAALIVEITIVVAVARRQQGKAEHEYASSIQLCKLGARQITCAMGLLLFEVAC